MLLKRLASAITAAKVAMAHPVVATISAAVGSVAVYTAIVTPVPAPQQQEPSALVETNVGDTASFNFSSNNNSKRHINIQETNAEPEREERRNADQADTSMPAAAPLAKKTGLPKVLSGTPNTASIPFNRGPSSNKLGNGQISSSNQVNRPRNPSATASVNSESGTNNNNSDTSSNSNISVSSSTVDQAPVLDFIADQTVAENSAMTTINAGDGGDDFDGNGDAITYTCTYGASLPCTSLPGAVSFTAATGAYMDT